MTTALQFPDGFRWGTATAAHQVEGGNRSNQWWAWEQQPGAIVNGDTSGGALEWWESAEADFDRMQTLGLNAHRLSVEWSRVEPRDGVFDDAALARYRAMLIGLRARGIEPMVTLHHFTNPLWLQELGGWLNPLVIQRFARFSGRVAAALGDQCDLWCTINEPNVHAVMTYLAGKHAPAPPANMGNTLRVVCNMIAGHVAAARAIKQAQPQARVGFAHHMRLFQGLRRANPFDALAARAQDAVFNEAILSSLLTGKWHLALRPFVPAEARAALGPDSLDWIGLNYYTRQGTRMTLGSAGTLGTIENFPGAQMSDFGYGEIFPAGLHTVLTRLHRTRLPVYITENGLPDHDDDQRPAFLLTHLREIWRGLQQQFDVRGYYHWSLVDNFEWNEGWRMKFGLYALDRATQARTLRNSGALYGEIARSNTLTADMAARYAPAVRL